MLILDQNVIIMVVEDLDAVNLIIYNQDAEKNPTLRAVVY